MWYFGVPVLGLAWLGGAVLRDRVPLLKGMYYVPPVVVVAAGAAWLLFARRRAPAWARAMMLGIVVAAAAKIVWIDTAWNEPQTAPADAFRVLQWNTASGGRDLTALWRTLGRDAPDLCFLSEAPLGYEFEKLSRQLIPGASLHAESGMAVISRYPLQHLASLRIPSGRGWVVRIDAPGGPMDVLMVDLRSNPFYDRFSPISAVADWVRTHDASVPLMVVGDFNTPRDSLAFEPLRRRMRHAYEIAGRGWPYSWPVPVPLYAIDHVWVSQSIRVWEQHYAFSTCSDHMRQLLRVSIAPRGDRP